MRERVTTRKPAPVVFSAAEQAEMRRLAGEGYGPSGSARQVNRAQDAVRLWLKAKGLVNTGNVPAPVTPPRVKAMGDHR